MPPYLHCPQRDHNCIFPQRDLNYPKGGTHVACWGRGTSLLSETGSFKVCRLLNTEADCSTQHTDRADQQEVGVAVVKEEEKIIEEQR